MFEPNTDEHEDSITDFETSMMDALWGDFENDEQEEEE